MAKRIKSHRDLIVWQRSMDLVTEIYRMTRAFPQSERFGLTAQLRRSGISIPSNISEGSARSGPNEFRHFVSIARGSAAELETLLEVSARLGFATDPEIAKSGELLEEVGRMLTVLRRKI